MSNVKFWAGKIGKATYFFTINLLGALRMLALRYKLDRAIFTCLAASIVFGSNYTSTTKSLENAPYIFRNINDYGIKCQRISSQKVIIRKPLQSYVGKPLDLNNAVCYIVYKRNDIEYTYTKLASALRGFLR